MSGVGGRAVTCRLAMAWPTPSPTIVDSLPDDWTDLELDLRIFDERRYVEAAVLLVTCNAQPYSKHDWHWRLIVAHRFGHAASAPAVHTALKLLDDAEIDGELAVREVRTGRAEVVQMWGRPESVRQEFKRLPRAVATRVSPAGKRRVEHRCHVGPPADDPEPRLPPRPRVERRAARAPRPRRRAPERRQLGRQLLCDRARRQAADRGFERPRARGRIGEYRLIAAHERRARAPREPGTGRRSEAVVVTISSG